jgi:hypothetical protein
MTEPNPSPVLNERVKPPLLNPPVRRITPSGDLTWVMLCCGVALGIFVLAYTMG